MQYVPGERVWCQVQGYPWWPAKVYAPDEQTEIPPNKDTMVVFYGTQQADFFNSADISEILPYEDSSEKNVTSDDLLQQSIHDCINDPDAEGLRTVEAAPHHTRAADRKRQRSPKRRDAPVTRKSTRGRPTAGQDMEQDLAAHLDSEFRSVSDNELVGLRKRMEEAADKGDISALRAALLECAGIRVEFQQLQSTKIGVAVGNLYGDSQFARLQALVHATICFWATSLPAETREALEQMQQLHSSDRAGPGAVAGGVGAAGGAAVQVSGGFADLVRKELTARGDLQRCAEKNLPIDLEAAVRGIESECRSAEERKLVVLHLRKDKHVQLREDLLSGAMPPKEFAAKLATLQTPEEAAQAAFELQEKAEAQLAAEAAQGGNYSEMFECPKCEKSKTQYYEKQIRSADEPATVFLTCLECKNQWTLN